MQSSGNNLHNLNREKLHIGSSNQLGLCREEGCGFHTSKSHEFSRKLQPVMSLQGRHLKLQRISQRGSFKATDI